MTKHIFLTALLLASPIFSGCTVSNSAYERGEIAALGAMLAFDSQDDIQRLNETREEILAFLASEQSLSDAIINRYALKIANRYQKNPAAIAIVLRKLKDELDLEGGEIRAREFLHGIADTLSLGA